MTPRLLDAPRFRVSVRGIRRDDVAALVAAARAEVAAGGTGAVAARDAVLSPAWFGYLRADVEWLRRRLLDSRATVSARRAVAVAAGRAAVTLAVAAVLAAWSPAALAVGLAAYLVVVLPLEGRHRLAVVSYRLDVDPQARTRYLALSAAQRWSLVGVLALLGWSAHRGAGALLLVWPADWWTRSDLALYCVVAFLAGSVIAVRARARHPDEMPITSFQLRRAAVLLPRTRADRVAFLSLSVTAGVVEELCYRGFGIAALRTVWPGATHPWLIVLTAAAFGFAHLYQGPVGVAGTGAVGAVLAFITLDAGTLWPAIVLHALLDARMVLLPRRFVERLGRPEPPASLP